jgi:hypothetical protein
MSFSDIVTAIWRALVDWGSPLDYITLIGVVAIWWRRAYADRQLTSEELLELARLLTNKITHKES